MSLFVSLEIGGAAITSAAVSGNAALSAFGGWQVQSVTSDLVIFEATTEAIVTSSFTGFSITTTGAYTNTLVRWLYLGELMGAGGVVLGSTDE